LRYADKLIELYQRMGNESSVIVEEARAVDPFFAPKVPSKNLEEDRKKPASLEMEKEKDEEPTYNMYREPEEGDNIFGNPLNVHRDEYVKREPLVEVDEDENWEKHRNIDPVEYEKKTGIPIDEQALLDIGPGSNLLKDEHPQANLLAIDTPAVEYEMHTGISIEEQVEMDLGPASHLFEDDIIEEEVVHSPAKLATN